MMIIMIVVIILIVIVILIILIMAAIIIMIMIRIMIIIIIMIRMMIMMMIIIMIIIMIPISIRHAEATADAFGSKNPSGTTCRRTGTSLRRKPSRYIIMLYRSILYSILFYYIILYSIISCYIILYHIILYYIIAYYIILYYIILYYIQAMLRTPSIEKLTAMFFEAPCQKAANPQDAGPHGDVLEPEAASPPTPGSLICKPSNRPSLSRTLSWDTTASIDFSRCTSGESFHWPLSPAESWGQESPTAAPLQHRHEGEIIAVACDGTAHFVEGPLAPLVSGAARSLKPLGGLHAAPPVSPTAAPRGSLPRRPSLKRLARLLFECRQDPCALPSSGAVRTISPLQDSSDDTDAMAEPRGVPRSPSLSKLSQCLFQAERPREHCMARAISPLEDLDITDAWEPRRGALPRTPSLRRLMTVVIIIIIIIRTLI